MKVQGDFDKACRYAEDIKNGVATQLSIFNFLPPEESEDKKKRISREYHRRSGLIIL